MKTLKRALLSFLIILCPPAFATDYYTASGDPVSGSALSSSVIRAEYAAIAAGFAKIAPYTSAGSRVLFINTGATAQTTDAELTYNGTTNLLTVNTSTFGLNTSIAGTLGVTGVATLTAQPILSSLTASLPVFTDGSKGLVSNAMTGTGNVMMSASPTTTGTLTAEIANFSGLGTFNAGATVASGQTLTLTGVTVTGGVMSPASVASAGAISGTTGTFTGSLLKTYADTAAWSATSRSADVVRIYNTTTADGKFTGIEFGVAGSTNTAIGGINLVHTGNASGALSFYTSGGGATTERVSISDVGAVKVVNLAGVGTRNVVVDANGVMSAP